LKKVLYKILLVVNAIFAFALLISYLAVHVNPEYFALPAFFGLAYPYLLFFNVILVIIWTALLKFEAFISLIVIAIGFSHFTNYIKLRKPVGDRADTFNVLSYNVRLFNYFENNNSSSSEKKVMEFLIAQKPNIICLQELYIIGDPHEKEEEIKKALGGKYFSHMKFISNGSNRFYGIVTLSQYPIIRKGEIIHPKSSSLSIFTDILIRKDTFRIYNNHLQSFRLKRMERSFIEEIAAPDEKKTITDIKSLYKSLKTGFVRRAIQSKTVKDHINQSPFPVIVAGDFNDTPVSYSYRKIRNGLHDSFVQSGYGAGFTYKGNYPPNRIDYILYDNTLINSYFEIIKVKYSDHYPIIANFKIND